MTSEEGASSVFHTSSRLVTDGGETRQHMGSCQTEMQLQDVAPGLTDQYSNFIHALQEPIDNSFSAIVKDEDYFDEPTDKEDDVVEICISIIKEGDLVWFIVADNGPGIPYDTLRRDIFLLGDQSSSDGILNNVGWGLKQSIAWFENQVNTNINIADSARDSNFRIITRSEEDGLLSVGGPIDGSLPIYREEESLWTEGLQGDPLEDEATGTRVYLPCTFDRVDEDLWKRGSADLSTRLHALQERLGLQYRDLLKARKGNRITIRYENKDDDTKHVYEVTPLDLAYDTEFNPDYPLIDEFEITADDVTYDITYERGILDYDEIWEDAEEADSGLVTSGGKLRWYKPSEDTAGADIYGNGRILTFSELDIFDRSYNQSLNYFGGTVRIIPQDSSEEVPTENKKVAIAEGSELWRKLAEKLRELGVEAKRYDDDEEGDGEEPDKVDEGEEGDGDERENGSGEEEESGEEKDEEESEEEGDEDEDGSDEGEGEEDVDEETDEENESEDDTEGDDDTDGEDTENGEEETDGEEESEGEDEDEETEDNEEDGDDTDSDNVVEKLKDANPDHSFEQDQVFDGAEVDLVETQEDGSVILWVIRSETATPADAYTLAMVQNHYKRENSSLSKVRLVAPDASSAFETDLSELQDYNDLQGDPYSIAYKPENEI